MDGANGVVEKSYPALGLNHFDYGYSASALLKIPVARRLHLSFRANYIQSLGSIAVGSSLYIRNVTGLVGLRWEN